MNKDMVEGPHIKIGTIMEIREMEFLNNKKYEEWRKYKVAALFKENDNGIIALHREVINAPAEPLIWFTEEDIAKALETDQIKIYEEKS